MRVCVYVRVCFECLSVAVSFLSNGLTSGPVPVHLRDYSAP